MTTTTSNENKLLDSREAARYLGLRLQTLAEWRCVGKGPAYIKMGRAIRYDTADLQAWLQRNRVEPTSA